MTETSGLVDVQEAGLWDHLWCLRAEMKQQTGAAISIQEAPDLFIMHQCFPQILCLASLDPTTGLWSHTHTNTHTHIHSHASLNKEFRTTLQDKIIFALEPGTKALYQILSIFLDKRDIAKRNETAQSP